MRSLEAADRAGKAGGTNAVEARSVRKAFYGLVANDDIDFDLQWGEVHAILGENGAGKTTLCSILAGLYRPDSGSIRVAGNMTDFRSPHDALQAGIGMVYQHFKLVDNFTVAENLVLGHPDTSLLVDRRRIENEAAKLIDRYDLAVDPTDRIWQLSVGEEQRVEILKLLYRDVRILILDEPTAVLTPQEATSLFETIRALADEGRAIVLVSHKLDEVLKVSDRITVLRNGRHVGGVDADSADAGTLAAMMIGRDLPAPPDRHDAENVTHPVLEVKGLRVLGDRGEEKVREVDVVVNEGEIVGIAGVSGNGQRELAEALAGLRPENAGTITLDGTDITGSNPRNRIRSRLAFVPEDRLAMGLAGGLTLEDNLVLKSYRSPPHSKGEFLSRRAIQQTAADLIDEFEIKGNRQGLPVRLLSGGNLQRAILARELSSRPKVLIAASPSRGLDVAAMGAIQNLLLERAHNGLGVLLLSEDLDEIHALSDRILVIFDGRIVGEVDKADADAETLGLLMSGRSKAEDG